MKKIMVLFMALILLAACGKDNKVENKEDKEPKIEVSEKEKEEYESVKFSPSLEDYTIDNLEDIKYFDDYLSNIDQASRDFLKENKFLVEDSMSFRSFEIYETNEYLYIPSVVTSDVVLNMYHTLYNSILRNVEENSLDKLQVLLENLYKESEKISAKLEDPKLKDLANKNRAYFYLALKLSGKELPLSEDISELVRVEEKNIESESLTASSLVDSNIDYSQFRIRGHYGQSESLKKYFKTMMFLSQENIKLMDNEGNIDNNNLAQGVLMAKTLEGNEESLKSYSELKSKFDFLVESPEDIDMEVLIKLCQDNKIEFKDLKKEKSMLSLAKDIEKFDSPQIRNYEGKKLSFMPQKAVLDNILMQNMVDTKVPSQRPIYSGLDVMAVLGNKYAENIILNDESNLKWPSFKDRYKESKLKEETIKNNDYLKNLYRLHLFVLKGFNNKDFEGYPSFMKNQAWQAKELNTQLASWAELKHDTLLYGKQVGAEMGGGEEKILKGYVEPQVEVYNRIIFSLDKMIDKLSVDDYLSEDYIANLNNFRDMVKFFLDVSIKELENKSLSQEEYDRINYIGGEFENIFVKFYDEKAENFYEIEEIAPSTQAVVADLMTVPSNSVGVPEGKYLEVGSGLAKPIYVVYKLDGELFIGRGAVSSYYEFLSDKRLTDDEFFEMLFNNIFNNTYKENMRPKFVENFEKSMY